MSDEIYAKELLRWAADTSHAGHLPDPKRAATVNNAMCGDKTTVEWKGAFYRGYMLNDPPPDLTDEVALKAITDLYTSTLASLTKKIEGGS